MVLPGSGLIKFSDLQTEFGGTNPILMSEYSTQSGVAANALVRLGTNFHGKSAAPVSPIPSNGLVAWYDGDSYVAGTKWVNKTGDTSNDILSTSFENIANITVNTHANGWKFLSGPANAGGIFTPLSLSTTYTLFHVAKYNGTQKERIFDANWGASAQNWLSGFHGGQAGVAFHQGWITNYTNLHGTNWVLSSDQNDPPLYRSNGVDRTLANVSANKLTTPASLAISVNERSDWAVAEFILYTRTLTLAEIQTVEAYLRNKYIGANI